MAQPIQLTDFGSPIDFSSYGPSYAAAREQRFLNQREKFSADQREEDRKQQTSEFMKNMLDDKNFASGTAEDPLISTQLEPIRAKAMDMAQKGARVADIVSAINGDVSNMHQIQQKAKFIKGEIDANLQKLGKDKGYDIEGVRTQAYKNAFFDANGNVKDPQKIDPAQDYVHSAMEANPGLANFNQLDEYIKGLPQRQESSSVTTYSKPGVSTRSQFDVKRPYYMDWDRDEKGNILSDQGGNPTGLVPKFDYLHDDDGKTIGRGLNQEMFNRVLRDNPSAAYAIRDQVQKLMPGVDYRDPKAQLLARKIAYDELQSRNNSYFKKVDQEHESAGAEKRAAAREQEQLAYSTSAASTRARLETEYKFGKDHPDYKPKKGDDGPEAPKALEQVVSGLAGNIKGESGSFDLAGYAPGGKIKYGANPEEVYKSVTKNDDGTVTFDKGIGKKGVETMSVDDAVKRLTSEGKFNKTTPAMMRKFLDDNKIKPTVDKVGKIKIPDWRKKGQEEFEKRMGGGIDTYNLNPTTPAVQGGGSSGGSGGGSDPYK